MLDVFRPYYFFAILGKLAANADHMLFPAFLFFPCGFEMPTANRCIKSRTRLKSPIIPVSKGGSNTARNIELLCETCSRSKSASSQLGCCVRQSLRAVLMSGRSCSAARVVFFIAQTELFQTVPQSGDANGNFQVLQTPFLEFAQGQNRLRPNPTA